jgi:hypothetical protein
MSIGDSHRTARCAPPFLIGGRWRCRGNIYYEGDGDGEGEGGRPSEGDEGRRRYLKADGEIEIKNG